MMKGIGLSFVRIGEFAWSRLEPNEGAYRFEWLSHAIETLDRAGLKVVLGTPTATPPKWLVDKMPDMAALDADGQSAQIRFAPTLLLQPRRLRSRMRAHR